MECIIFILYKLKIQFFVIRDHNLKRSICKSCQCPLIPGETAKIRLLPRKKKILNTTCLMCQKSKRIPVKPKYKLWLDQPEAVAEILQYENSYEESNKKAEIDETNSKKKN